MAEEGEGRNRKGRLAAPKPKRTLAGKVKPKRKTQEEAEVGNKSDTPRRTKSKRRSERLAAKAEAEN
jgi:hypothetical protein